VLDKGHSSSAEVADDLVLQNHIELAQAVRRFVARMPGECRESPGVSPSARFFNHGNVAANQRSRAVPGLVGRGLAEGAKSGSWNLFWCGNCRGGRGTGQSLPSTQRAPMAAPAPFGGYRDFSVRFRYLGLGFRKRTVAQDSLKTANTCFKSTSCRRVAPSSPGSGDFLPKPGFL
jgi:hypothetical protein